MSGEYDYDYETAKPSTNGTAGKARSRGGFGRLGGFLSALFTIAFVFAVAAGGVLFYLKTQFESAGPLKDDTSFAVISGQGLASIAESLESRGFISDSRIFIAGVVANDAKSKLKAGEYLLPAGSSMQKIMETLVSGKSVQHKVTIPEGITSFQVVERLKEHPILVGEVDELPPEGSLLPDTYVFLRGTTRKDLLQRMRRAQDKAIEGLWSGRNPDLPIKSKQAALILASIVEKETGKAQERARVASVFINRLRRGIRLQSDPTIIYGIVGGRGVLDRPILKTDIAKKTEYNTYHINGLPPTPIANPGFAAIKAVLNPAKTKDYYFVADGTGGHAFARTLAEHNRNVSKWRKIEAKRRSLAASKAALAGAAKKPEEKSQNKQSDADSDVTATASLSAANVAPVLPPAPPAPPSLDRSESGSSSDSAAKSPSPPAPALKGSSSDPAPPAAPTLDGTPQTAPSSDPLTPTTKQAKVEPDAAPEPAPKSKAKSRSVRIPIPRPKPAGPTSQSASTPDNALPDSTTVTDSPSAVPVPITPPASRPARKKKRQPVQRNIIREPDRR